MKNRKGLFDGQFSQRLKNIREDVNKWLRAQGTGHRARGKRLNKTAKFPLRYAPLEYSISCQFLS